VLAGVESIGHGIYLDDEVISQMKQRGTFLIPMLHAPRGVLKKEAGRDGTMLPQSLRKTQEVLATTPTAPARRTRRAYGSRWAPMPPSASTAPTPRSWSTSPRSA